jgi:uncharacterized protein with von Willebrand factor type A (vWA) domain
MEYPLEELFLALRRRGLPLRWRDYEDALAALAGGFGVGRRHDLLRILQILWARSDAELRALEQAMAEIAPPAPEEIEKYTHPRRNREPERSVENGPTSGGPHASDRVENAIALEFGGIETRGTPIPRPVLPRLPSEAFVLTPEPPVTLRSLIIAWRRFRKRLREGPSVELDVAGSIAEQCRAGRLLAPVLRPERKNRARVLLLVDVSPSMAAWSMLLPMWQESMAQGQLGSAGLYYFSNVPGDVLYAHRALREPIELEEVVRTQARSTLLIFSDGGAARGNRSRRRMEQTRAFLKRTGVQWSPVVWINPMPEVRWNSTTAAWLARQPRLHMLPLAEASVARAIDLLRGTRVA